MVSSYQFKGRTVDLEELKAELRKMSDIELLKFTEAVGRRKRKSDLDLLNEASAWKRRNPPSR